MCVLKHTEECKEFFNVFATENFMFCVILILVLLQRKIAHRRMTELSLAEGFYTGGLYFLKDLNNLRVKMERKSYNRLKQKHCN